MKIPKNKWQRLDIEFRPDNDLQPVFREVQPGAEARVRAKLVRNLAGTGDAVEQRRKEVREAHAAASKNRRVEPDEF